MNTTNQASIAADLGSTGNLLYAEKQQVKLGRGEAREEF